MKQGDLVRYKDVVSQLFGLDGIYIVRRVELKSDWVFVYGVEVPIQIKVMEVVSEA